MILVDTSVWIDHFSSGNGELVLLLERGGVLIHPFVLGELACGFMSNRSSILAMLQALPEVPVATNSEVLNFIENQVLWRKGIGWVDAHLLASALLANVGILTYDKRMMAVAKDLGVAPGP